ncbi:hypothetical protein BCR43DRAFT_132176 [Syncephalastrum racemosum]|uniref:Uncharacterized protein n=1 Tax=Syncephalastrum racemosum TaxID=13706 RepID=A0A1X2HLA0_SYNRA|nr:hypothetical protein BCR43DRAFT_132176 [Syncephalastrum racemosum]
MQAPVILERRERPDHVSDRSIPHQTDKPPAVKVLQSPTSPPASIPAINTTTTTTATTTNTVKQQQNQQHMTQPPSTESVWPVPFYKRHSKFNTDAILKILGDQPGHFVVGVVGKQNAGKSTILSSFTQRADQTFHVGNKGIHHVTSGIDMILTQERVILLDTEPVLSTSVLADVAQKGHSMEGLRGELWLETETLYSLIFMLSVCNVLVVVSEGGDMDIQLLQLLRRAEMLKFNIPDLPLLYTTGQPQQTDMNYFPNVVFVCNKCENRDFTWQKYRDMQLLTRKLFSDSELKISGLVALSADLPSFVLPWEEYNVYFLPYIQQGDNPSKPGLAYGVETFDVLAENLWNQVTTAPRRGGKKGQVSEKDWFRNAMKLHELTRKSGFIADYIKMAKKL